MNSIVAAQEGSGLTKESFERLLTVFDSDRERAGEKYESLRRKLVKFFEWRSCAVVAIDLADETINRVARRIDGGTIVRDVSSYAYGVARIVYLETLKEMKQAEALRERLTTDISSVELREAELRECFEACLRRQPDASRELIVAYYQEQRRTRIKLRQELADRLGVPINALRIRAHRIRLRLEECVASCLHPSGPN